MLLDVTAGVFTLATAQVPLPVLGAGLAVVNLVPGGIGPNGLWLPISLVIALSLAVLPFDRLGVRRQRLGGVASSARPSRDGRPSWAEVSRRSRAR